MIKLYTVNYRKVAAELIILQAQDLTKRFNGEEIFSNVNMAVQEKKVELL